ncbi:MAG: ParA family protein [Caldimonas sp.]
MKTLVLANQKGGVGKSAVATLLAQYFNKKGKRTLAIDLDHQSNYGKALMASKRPTVARFSADQLLTEPAVVLEAAPFVLVPAADGLLRLESQGTLHNQLGTNLRNFFRRVDEQFDVCVIDTHPIPDIRYISATASADFVLAPIQLNQEAVDGVALLLSHPRVGIRKIKAVLNPKLHFLGLLPVAVEATPFQKANLVAVLETYGKLLIPLSDKPGDVARIWKRSAVAEAQADGLLLWEMKKTAARETWREIEPCLERIASLVLQTAAPEPADAV